MHTLPPVELFSDRLVAGTETPRGGHHSGTAIVVFVHLLPARYAVISLLIQGIILVSIMLLAPQGILGFIRKTQTYRSMSHLITRR